MRREEIEKLQELIAAKTVATANFDAADNAYNAATSAWEEAGKYLEHCGLKQHEAIKALERYVNSLNA